MEREAIFILYELSLKYPVLKASEQDSKFMLLLLPPYVSVAFEVLNLVVSLFF